MGSWWELVEERLQAPGELAGGVVGQVVGRAEIGPTVRVVDGLVTASGALDRVDNPAAWLYRSARNAVIDHYRTRRRHEPLDDTDRWPDLGPTDNVPNDATRELARCLQPLLDQLPPAAHDALSRVDVGGQTHQQAADQLGISVSGMKSRVQRARHQLKDLLEQCCAVEVDRTGAVAAYHPAAGTCGCAADAPCSAS